MTGRCGTPHGPRRRRIRPEEGALRSWDAAFIAGSLLGGAGARSHAVMGQGGGR